MNGQRVIIKVNHPRGLDNFPIDLYGTQGVIVAAIGTSGAMIECDADNNSWAFSHEEFEILDAKGDLSEEE